MRVGDIPAFLQGHTHQKISVGKSGADVYAVGHDMLLKHARREALSCAGIWDSYVTEARMYDWFREKRVSWVPELLYERRTPHEVVLLLRRYRMLEHEEAVPRLAGIMQILAQIHALPVPDFLDAPKRFYTALPPERLQECLEGWKSVLAEHGGRFNTGDAAFVAKHFDMVNECFHPQTCMLTHGDFHCDNLLLNERGELLVCDWQNVNIGTPAGDIAFFLSRLSADGASLNADALIESYCAAAEAIGISADPETIRCDMTLSSLNAAFLFWHRYLHDNPPERVGGIFHKMTADTNWLLSKV